MAKNQTRKAISISKDTYEKLTVAAEASKKSRSGIVEEALKMWHSMQELLSKMEPAEHKKPPQLSPEEMLRPIGARDDKALECVSENAGRG